MIIWHLETRKISSLKPHPKNPRKITKEQNAALAASLEKYGLADVFQTTIDGMIIGGHQRIRELKKKGVLEVPCLVPDRELSEDEVDGLLLSLNKIGGEFDWDIIANEFDAPILFDSGFTAEDLHLDLDDKAPKEKKDKECPHCGGKL